jgi:hypothetical protein
VLVPTHRVAGIAALSLLAAFVLTPVAASASEDAVPDTIEVCAGNSLETSTAPGESMTQREIALAVRQLEDMCSAGVGTTITFEKYLELDPGEAAYDYANVVAQIRTRPGAMSIVAYANAIPRDGKTKELSCIYRLSPSLALVSRGLGAERLAPRPTRRCRPAAVTSARPRGRGLRRWHRST